MVVEERQREAVVDKSRWAWFKAILYVVLGIAMLSILAEPLTESVHNFSNSVGLNPFLMSFILVPLATNAREATSAIKEASHKKPRTTSLAISEVSILHQFHSSNSINILHKPFSEDFKIF